MLVTWQWHCQAPKTCRMLNTDAIYNDLMRMGNRDDYVMFKTCLKRASVGALIVSTGNRFNRLRNLTEKAAFL